MQVLSGGVLACVSASYTSEKSRTVMTEVSPSS